MATLFEGDIKIREGRFSFSKKHVELRADAPELTVRNKKVRNQKVAQNIFPTCELKFINFQLHQNKILFVISISKKSSFFIFEMCLFPL